jgi:hypothetical protein
MPQGLEARNLCLNIATSRSLHCLKRSRLLNQTSALSKAFSKAVLAKVTSTQPIISRQVRLVAPPRASRTLTCARTLRNRQIFCKPWTLTCLAPPSSLPVHTTARETSRKIGYQMSPTQSWRTSCRPKPITCSQQNPGISFRSRCPRSRISSIISTYSR